MANSTDIAKALKVLLSVTKEDAEQAFNIARAFSWDTEPKAKAKVKPIPATPKVVKVRAVPKARACKLCKKTGHNARTCPDKGKKDAAVAA